MNQFFFESRGKEKIRDLMKEGMTSQEYHRSGAARHGLLHRLPRLILIALIIAGFLGIILR